MQASEQAPGPPMQCSNIQCGRSLEGMDTSNLVFHPWRQAKASCLEIETLLDRPYCCYECGIVGALNTKMPSGFQRSFNTLHLLLWSAMLTNTGTPVRYDESARNEDPDVDLFHTLLSDPPTPAFRRPDVVGARSQQQSMPAGEQSRSDNGGESDLDDDDDDDSIGCDDNGDDEATSPKMSQRVALRMAREYLARSLAAGSEGGGMHVEGNADDDDHDNEDGANADNEDGGNEDGDDENDQNNDEGDDDDHDEDVDDDIDDDDDDDHDAMVGDNDGHDIEMGMDEGMSAVGMVDEFMD